jgi:hypothetical protein
MQVIIYENENGGVSVCIPTGELPIQRVLEKDCPSGAIIVEQESLPNEHNDFFNSWELNGSTVTVNLSKAKEQTKTRLRFEREPLLQAQDVLFQRAQENGADTSTIVAEKERLRDITNLVDTCTSLEQLKNLNC